MGYMKEFGRAGQKRTGGIFYEEFLPELQGKKGIETYREMADNDDVVGAIFFAVDMLIRGCSWDTHPGGNTPADEEAADFVWQCMNDMTETWIDTISEILSMLTYGWSAHEIVYKRRMGRKKDIRLNSKYNDGRIGWQKLPIRSQETLYRWEYDDNDNLLGLTQMPPPKFDLITIPANKLLLFRTKSSKKLCIINILMFFPYNLTYIWIVIKIFKNKLVVNNVIQMELTPLCYIIYYSIKCI